MPKITSIIKIASVSLALAALFGCGNKNGDAAPGLDNGQHPANWVQQHAAVYKDANGGSAQYASGTPCSQCHGALLDGGDAKVSCFQAQWNGVYCHPNADKKLGHPNGWVDKTSASFHGFAQFNGKAVQGSTTLSADCGLCHSVNGTASGVADAPSCLASSDNFTKFGMSCHATSPAVANASTGCVSCHSYKDGSGNLTGPTGSSAPNRAGAHDAHLSLPGVTCGTCHSGYGTGTAKHATAPAGGIAFLNLSSSARAESGTFGYSAGSCVAAICHGGKTTPAWTSQFADLTTACTNCHSFKGVAAPQYNDYFSGNVNGANENLHTFHLAQINPLLLPATSQLIFCTDCHNGLSTEAGVLNHFGTLSTPGFEVTPRTTLGGAITVYAQSNVPTLYNCTNDCHAKVLPLLNPAPWPTN